MRPVSTCTHKAQAVRRNLEGDSPRNTWWSVRELLQVPQLHELLSATSTSRKKLRDRRHPSPAIWSSSHSGFLFFFRQSSGFSLWLPWTLYSHPCCFSLSPSPAHMIPQLCFWKHGSYFTVLVCQANTAKFSEILLYLRKVNQQSRPTSWRSREYRVQG